MKHELKILPCYFDAVMRGDKNFEIREDTDRGFQRGDIAVLFEHEPGAIHGRFTGRQVEVEITYVTAFKQQPGMVVFAFRRVPVRQRANIEAPTTGEGDAK